jgi:hypothetical protein
LNRFSTGTVAYSRTKSTASRWLATISPKLTNDRRRSSSITVLRAKAPPSILTISSCSSWSGLPSRTQLAALGCSMKRALWKVVMVSAWATPGAITFRPPDQPAMKCGSTRPVASFRSASTNRRSSLTRVPRVGVAPRSTWSASRSAKWFRTSTVRSTQGSPTSSASSAPSFGRCRPVATRILMLAASMPASRSWRTTTGRNRPFGTGRVMSQIRMQAVRRPFAILASGGLFTGLARAPWTAATGSGRTGMVRLRITVTSSPGSSSTGSRPRP